jgi:methionine-rich copper-binding protein CopC
MGVRQLVVLCVLAIAAWAGRSDAWAQKLEVIDSWPKDHAVIEGPSEGFLVRFDRPVDHLRSVLFIKRSGEIVDTLHPRFQSAPEVLFARATSLTPGSYTLQWSVRTLEGTDELAGEIAFEVVAPKTGSNR